MTAYLIPMLSGLVGVFVGFVACAVLGVWVLGLFSLRKPLPPTVTPSEGIMRQIEELTKG